MICFYSDFLIIQWNMNSNWIFGTLFKLQCALSTYKFLESLPIASGFSLQIQWSSSCQSVITLLELCWEPATTTWTTKKIYAQTTWKLYADLGHCKTCHLRLVEYKVPLSFFLDLLSLNCTVALFKAFLNELSFWKTKYLTDFIN